MSNEKKWNPELWKPIGIKQIDLTQMMIDRPELQPKVGEKHSFLGYHENIDRTHSFLGYHKYFGRKPYEVRGIMPKAPANLIRKVPW